MQEQAVREKESVRILFVDNEPNVLPSMPDILRQRGYDVTAVGTVNSPDVDAAPQLNWQPQSATHKKR